MYVNHAMNENTTSMAGAILIDKPIGITSQDAVNLVRRIANTRRVGHAGTLDPLASGLLLVAIGQATRLLDYTHAWTKTYETEITLGATSTTDDSGGEISDVIPAATKVIPALRPSKLRPGRSEVGKAGILQALQKFIGTCNQAPPAYAAIKIGGKKLYEYARQDLDEAKRKAGEKSRPVRIFNIELQKYDWPELKIKVVCGSGTYIRSLARDIGETLGCGGYVKKLRRTGLGIFCDAQTVKTENLTPAFLAANLMPPKILVSHLPAIKLDEDNVAKLRQGRAVPYLGKTKADIFAIEDSANNLAGLAKLDPINGTLLPRLILS